MEILSYIPTWLLLILLMLILLYTYLKKPYNLWSSLKVNGPPPSLVFGNVKEMHDPKIGSIVAINGWREIYGRVFGIYFFREPLLLILDLDIVKRIFIKDFNGFANRWFLGGGNLQQPIIKKGVFFAEGVDWKRIRRIMSPTFTSGKLKTVSHHVNITGKHLGDCLVRYAQEGNPADAKTVFGAFALDAICRAAFGLDVNSQDNYDTPFIVQAKDLCTFGIEIHLKFLATALFKPVGSLLHALGIGVFRKGPMEFFERNVSAIISERKTDQDLQKRADYLQLLMNAEAEPDEHDIGAKKLSTSEITAQGIIFILAGYETTSSTLQFIFYHIAKRPDVQNMMLKEIISVVGWDSDPTYDQCQQLTYMDAVIHETLRLCPPLHNITRLTEEEVVIGDITVPAHTGIVIPIASIMRDPEYFPEPEIFNPDRFLKDQSQPYSFLAFGLGPRQCIGMRLALMEVKIALVHALRRVEICGDGLPDKMEFDESTGLLKPRYPIKLVLKTREEE